MDKSKDKKMLLINKCREVIGEFLDNVIPETGSFRKHPVFCDYPDTDYKAVLWIEAGGDSRYLCIGMKQSNDDRLVHHYYKKGTNRELREYISSDIAAEDIYTELEALKLSVDDLD